MSFEETEWYLDVIERDRSGRGPITDADIDRKNDLDDRHPIARLRLAAAEYETGSKTRPDRHSWLIGKPEPPAIHPGAVAMAGKRDIG